MDSRDRIVTCGTGHHFIGARNCLYRISTFFDDIAVSTIGLYFPGARDKIELVGSQYFETFVFRTDNDWSPKTYEVENGDGGTFVDRYEHPDIVDWTELDAVRYMTTGAANRGHWNMVEKWKRVKEMNNE